MTKKHNKSDSLNHKMDKLLDKFVSVEEKLDKRMSKIESDCRNLKKKSDSHDKKQKRLSNEVSQLKAKLNEIEQQNLNCNMIIKGVKEEDTEEAQHTGGLAEFLCKYVYKELDPTHILISKRIGVKNQHTRPILVQFRTEETKSLVMDAKKKVKLDCSKIPSYGNKPLGTADEIIYFSDHLTPFSATLYYHARLLKKQLGFKYVWTKIGHIYVRENDQDRAILIKSLEQITAIKKNHKKRVLSSTKNDTISSEESSSESSAEEEESIVEEMDDETATASGNKRNRSSETTKKAPSPKRPNTRGYKH